MTPLDPMLNDIAQGAKGRPSLYDMAPADARAAFDGRTLAKPRNRPEGMRTEDVVIPGAPPLNARVYRPADCSIGATIVFLHGGGYMLGGINQMDEEAAFVAGGTRSVVLSLDYRLAPEHKLPLPVMDTIAALEWARENIGSLGGRSDRLCVAGESAGANIAASAAIAMRDKGEPLAGQLLFVPAPDLAALGAMEDGDRDYPLLTPAMLRRIAELCLPSLDAGGKFPFSAAHAPDLSRLPPTAIGLAGHCPTKDVGAAFAARLEAAGNAVVLRCFENMFHPYLAFTGASPAAKEAAGTLLADFVALLEQAGGRPA